MGQINPDMAFGALIKEIAREPDVKSIVDIGAWNGLGTTRCIMEGVGNRTDVHVYSYENKKDFWQVAVRNWQGNDKVTVIYGRLTDRLMTPDEITAHRHFANVKDHYDLWYADDVKCFMDSPLVPPPDTIDFVVIDGGEFSTQGDWDVVSKYEPKYIGLDDTHVIKCSDIEAELDNNSKYEKIGSGTDRNGWALFKLKQ